MRGNIFVNKHLRNFIRACYLLLPSNTFKNMKYCISSENLLEDEVQKIIKKHKGPHIKYRLEGEPRLPVPSPGTMVPVK